MFPEVTSIIPVIEMHTHELQCQELEEMLPPPMQVTGLVLQTIWRSRSLTNHVDLIMVFIFLKLQLVHLSEIYQCKSRKCLTAMLSMSPKSYNSDTNTRSRMTDKRFHQLLSYWALLGHMDKRISTW